MSAPKVPAGALSESPVDAASELFASAAAPTAAAASAPALWRFDVNAVTPWSSASASAVVAVVAAAAGAVGTRPARRAVGAVDAAGGTALPVAGKAAPDFASSEVFDALLFLAGLLSASFRAPAKVVAPGPPVWDAEAEADTVVEGPVATGADT
jgi:hypothetical protein